MKKRLIAAAFVAALALPGIALPCGGPAFDRIDQALLPIDDFIAWSAVQECDAEEADSSCSYLGSLATIFELRFLYPFHLAKPADYTELLNRSYHEYEFADGRLPKDPLLSAETLSQKVKARDWAGAETEARSLVDKILNMPLVQANENHDVLARAVAAIDLKSLTGTVPAEKLEAAWRGVVSPYRPVFLRTPAPVSPFKEARAATLRFIELKEAMRAKIPDGWRETIQKEVKPETWSELESLHTQWLTDFPGHPLVDLVKLSEVRLAYLQNRPGEAWKRLFSLYARRPVRAVAEMRFLLQQELAPDPAAIPDDPILLAGLAPWIKFRNGASWNPLWTRLWNISAAKAKTPWGINLQERLIKRVADEGSAETPPPEGFPTSPLNPNPRWATFRLFALYKLGLWDEALAQAGTMKLNGYTAATVAKLHLRRKDWKGALAVKELPPETKRYLIRVLFDDETLRSLQDLSDPKLRNEVRLTLAVRAAAKGDWQAGTTLLPEGDLRRSGLWEQAARLSADKTPAGELALGRFLKKNDGKLFYPPDTVWYRSVFWRLNAVQYRTYGDSTVPPQADPGLPWSAAAESEAIRNHLKSLEPFLALRAYATYLSTTDGKGKERTSALKEADQAYNWLLNWANNYSKDWQDLLDGSEEAKIIRQAGKGL